MTATWDPFFQTGGQASYSEVAGKSRLTIDGSVASGQFYYAIQEALPLIDLTGTKQYLEFEIVQIDPSVTTLELVVYTGIVPNNPTGSPPNGAGRVSITQNGTLANEFNWSYQDPDSSFYDANYGGPVDSSNYPNSLGAVDDFEPGDIFGILWETGTENSAMSGRVSFWYNGNMIWQQPFFIDDLVNNEIRVGMRAQAPFSGPTTIIDINEDSDTWTYDPTDNMVDTWDNPKMPFIQEWSVTRAAIGEANSDTGYARLQDKFDYRKDTTVSFKAGARIYDRNLTARVSESSVSSRIMLVEGTQPRCEGKYYFEIEFLEFDQGGNIVGPSMGIHSGMSETGGGNDTHFFRWQSRRNFGVPRWEIPNGGAGADDATAQPVTGDIFMFAFDLRIWDDNQIPLQVTSQGWVGKNGTWFNRASDPSLGMGQRINFEGNADIERTWYRSNNGMAWVPSFQVGCDNNSDWHVRFNFGAEPFAYTVPNGFVAWDDTAFPVKG